MGLKTGMLVGVIGTENMGVLIQIRSSSNTCVIKLNNGTLLKNIPLDDVEEAKDMNDTKDKKSPIRLSGGAVTSSSKSPSKLTSLSIETRKNDKLKTILEVGDSVKARCNGGSRWFPGKILHVHRDGSYDVKYSDGEIEKKMAALDVELALKLDKTLLKTSNSRESGSFAVGDKVKARYNGGKKLFPGKIKRVHSDNTYDVLYDDGDEEKRVKAANIEALEAFKAVSDKEKEETKRLSIGKKVKARYKKGKRLFPGKISRVRSDGTYDIDYDDGEVETHVEFNQIEVSESEDLFADSDDDKKKITKKTVKKWVVGDFVKAYYGKGKKLFSGKIVKVHMNGTYDIKYEDGDSEVRVEGSFIEDSGSNKADADVLVKSQVISRMKRPFRVGDAVKAKYKRGAKFFPGKITRERMDGTYDIKFEDGDVEERVEVVFIQRLDADEDKEEDNLKQKKMKKSFQVGDVVKAPFQRGIKLFRGKISRVRSDGTYDIVFDDGDEDTHISGDLIQLEEGDEELNKVGLKVGDTVKARYKKGKKAFAGTVTRIRSDGTYDVQYEDGDIELRVDMEMIEVPERKKDVEEVKTAKKRFKVGNKVRARYNKGSKMFSGEITAIHHDDTYDVRYNDGDKEKKVEAKDIELEEEETKHRRNLKVEDSDSDSKKKKSGKKKGLIQLNDVVEANFKRKGKFHRGKIVRVRSDNTFDIEYDVGASEKHVQVADIKVISENQDQNDEEGEVKSVKKKLNSKTALSSDSDGEMPTVKAKKSVKKSKSHSSSESSDSDRQFSLQKGTRVTYRKAEDTKSQRVGIVRKVRSDGTCDVKYQDGNISKRVSKKLLIGCSDSEDSDDNLDNKVKHEQELNYRRNERVMSNWRRGSQLSKPKLTEKWTRAVVLEKNSDGTYTIRYKDGVVEEDVPSNALKSCKKQSDSENDGKASAQRRLKRARTNEIGTESLFLLEQLALTLFEEGSLKKKPKLQLLRDGNDSSSSDSSLSSSESGSSSSKSRRKKKNVDKILKRLFDSSSLTTYKRMFKENDIKNVAKISRSRIIALVEEFMKSSKSTKDNSRIIQQIDEENSSVKHILTEWFATHDDLRTHRHFDFKTLLLAFAYAKNRLGKQRMEQSVVTVLEGRFASFHETKRQLELWQQKLGYRLFETLQRHFHDRALPNMIPSRIKVSAISLIFDQIAREAMPNKPLAVYLQQQQLFPHQTLFLAEFLCCYYQLYGSETTSSRWNLAVELRPIAFVASCLFSNGDFVCKRHGDLVRRLSVGRTQAQLELILRFREAFESLLSLDADCGIKTEELLLETSQLSKFAAKVASDPSILEPAMNLLRKRAAAVSLVEIYGSCGFLIDELTSAPTIRNAIEKMRMRVDLADVRRIIGLIRNICIKILRFPNNADYWRIRADSAAFQQKIGRFDGATHLLEAVGFVEYQKAHYEVRGARNIDGKRISALEKPVLDALREKCVQLDGELSLFDGVESLSSILERIAKVQTNFTLDECQIILKHLSVYVENILKKPKDSRCWRIREANGTFQRQIGYLPHVVDLMESIGFDLVPTSHGNVYTLRGTGTPQVLAKKSDQETLVSASLSNFAFTSVSSQMEWFLWRRKQEIESLLEDEMRYLHEIVGQSSQAQIVANSSINAANIKQTIDSSETRDDALLKMYPYGTNAIDTFNKTSIQRLQLEMIKNVFGNLDVAQKGFLVESDFTRGYGLPSILPVWTRFDTFDLNKDGKVDLTEFVAALGPLLDHPYELTTNTNRGQTVNSCSDDSDQTLCEAISSAVGGLRIGTSCSAAAAALKSLINYLLSIVQEPDNTSLWSINDKMAIGRTFLRFPACRELLRLIGFHEAVDLSSDNNSGTCTRNYELKPQRVRFKTSTSVSEQISSLDTGTLKRIHTIISMLAGHHRGSINPSVSDVSAVSRAVANWGKHSENWVRAVQIVVKCLQNIEKEPSNPRYREINTTTTTFTKSVGSVKGGSELLFSVGFRETDSGSLRFPLESSIEELRARRLELEVGLIVLNIKATNHEAQISVTEPQKSENGQKVMQTSSKSRNLRVKSSRHRPVTTAIPVQNPTKRLTKELSRDRARTSTSTDSIKKATSVQSKGSKSTKLGRSTSSVLARKTVHNRPLSGRKQAPNVSPPTVQ